MKWHHIVDRLTRKRYATADDVRKIFPDHRKALYWLAGFLVGGDSASSSIVDACTIADRRGLVFHEWLAHWAARATVRRALQSQRDIIAQLGSGYEQLEPVHTQHRPLSAEDLQLLVEQSASLRFELDPLCRFVLVMHGLAKDSCEEVAGQLGVSSTAVERAYGFAFVTLHGHLATS